MSFPESFSRHLWDIMKGLVADLTALVEDGVEELRLELLRDRDRQILEKEREIEERDREIEERDRVIEELRAAVEELTAREEAALSPEESSQPEWSKEEKETKLVVKPEPTEKFTAGSKDPHVSVWPPPSLSTTTATADTAVACSFDSNHEIAGSYSQFSQETEDFPHMDQAELPLDTFINGNQEQFFPDEQPEFSLPPNLSQEEHSDRDKSMKKRTKRRDYGTFRCDQCSKTFVTKCRLITHQSVHTGARPYSCETCGKGFSRTDSLTRHKRKPGACYKNHLEKKRNALLGY